MLKATSTVALITPENDMPVPGVDRMAGLTMTMYAIVTKVVTPPTMIRRDRAGGSGGRVAVCDAFRSASERPGLRSIPP